MDLATVRKLLVAADTPWPTDTPRPPPYELTLEERDAREAARDGVMIMAATTQDDNEATTPQLPWLGTTRGYDLASNMPDWPSPHVAVLQFWGGIMVEGQGGSWVVRHPDLPDRLKELRRLGQDIYIVVTHTPMQEAVKASLEELGTIAAYVLRAGASVQRVVDDINYNEPHATWYFDGSIDAVRSCNCRPVSHLLDEPFDTDDPHPLCACHF
jgi:hypothetical protein